MSGVFCQFPRDVDISLTAKVLSVGEVTDHGNDGKYLPNAFPDSAVQL